MVFLFLVTVQPVALVDIIDCTSEMGIGGKKTANYTTNQLRPSSSASKTLGILSLISLTSEL